MHIDRNSNRPFWGFLLALPGLLLTPSQQSQAQTEAESSLQIIQVRVGEHRVNAELADTDLSRQLGLMNRPFLAKDAGMVFLFPQGETHCMWMKNTLIDLDVAFADESGRILNIEQMKAGSTDIHCSRGAARIALEMNRNWFVEKAVKPGQFILLREHQHPRQPMEKQ